MDDARESGARSGPVTELAALRAAVDLLSDAVYVVDRSSRVVLVNPAAERLAGRPAWELLGRPAAGLFAPEGAAGVAEARARVLAGGGPEALEAAAPVPGGAGERTFVTARGPVRDASGVVVGVAAVVRDVTEARGEAAAARRSESAYRLLADRATDCISLHGPDGVLHYVSPACRNLLGYEPEDMVGRSLYELIHPDDAERARESIADAIANGVVRRDEFRVRHREGHWVWVETTGHRIEGADGTELHCVSRDVTARREAELARREHEAMLRSFYDTVPVMTGVMELRGDTLVFVSANAAAAAAFHGSDAESMAGVSVRDLGVRDFDRIDEAWMRHVREAHETGQVTRFEFQERVGDEDRWRLVALKEIERGPGLAPWFSFTVEDVTDRKRTEAALRSSEERFRLLAENANDLILMTDREGILQYASPSSRAVLGYEPEELMGRHGAEFVHPDDLTEVLAAAARKPPFRVVCRALHRSGSSVWLESEVSPVRDPDTGRIVRVQNISRDITRRVEAQQALRESEARLALAMDASGMGFWDWDIPSSKVFYSDRWYTMLGYEPGEMPPDLATWERLTHPDDAKRVLVMLEEHFAGLRPALSEEFRMRSKDGSWRWILSFGRLVSRDAAGRPLRAMGVHTDVTDRKRVERELEEYAGRLTTLRRIEQAVLSGRTPERIAQASLEPLSESVPGAALTILSAGKRTSEWQVLARVGALESLLPDRLRLTSAEIGREELRALRAGRTVVVGDLDAVVELTPAGRMLREAGLRSYVRVPLAVDSELLGCLNLFSGHPQGFPAEVLALVREAAGSLAVALRHARLHQEVGLARRRLEQLSRRLMRSQEDERRWIARELHDELGQGLSVLKLDLTVARRAAVDPELARTLEFGAGQVERMIRQVRELSRGLWPAALDDLGLVPALRAYTESLAERSGLTIELDVDDSDGRASPEVEAACFRVVQEALTNVLRHAGATRVTVELRRAPDGLRLRVTDDGKGFDSRRAEARARRGASLGLLGMRERASLAGGRLSIHSAPGQGAVVRAVFPVENPPPGEGTPAGP